jgi:hypothetical protein
MTTRPSPPDLESIRKLVHDADVEGLIEIHGAPANEYDKEAEAIHAAIAQLQPSEITASKLLSTLEVIWRRNFIDDDVELALRRPALRDIAEKIARVFGPEAQPQTRRRGVPRSTT